MTSSPFVANVLVVDDRADFRQLVAEILRPHRIRVFGCEDGGEVLEHYEREAPQWVVMDIKMRKVDGLTATRELLRRHPAAQVIVVSGHDQEAMKKAALAAGAMSFLSKESLGLLPGLILQNSSR